MFPALIRKLFSNSGRGSTLNREILPLAGEATSALDSSKGAVVYASDGDMSSRNKAVTPASVNIQVTAERFRAEGVEQSLSTNISDVNNTATGALELANTAYTTASTALGTAQNADNKADSAIIIANAANNTAEEALALAESLEGNISAATGIYKIDDTPRNANISKDPEKSYITNSASAGFPNEISVPYWFTVCTTDNGNYVVQTCHTNSSTTLYSRTGSVDGEGNVTWYSWESSSMSSVIKDVRVEVNPSGQPEGTYLVIVSDTESGETYSYINFTQLLSNVYTSGNGAIGVSTDYKIYLQLDPNNSKGLHVAATGLQTVNATASTATTDGIAGTVIYAKDSDNTSRNKAATPIGVASQVTIETSRATSKENALEAHINTLDSNKVSKDTLINTANPLQGGGSLNSNVNLSIVSASPATETLNGNPGTVVYAADIDVTSRDKAVTPNTLNKVNTLITDSLNSNVSRIDSNVSTLTSRLDGLQVVPPSRVITTARPLIGGGALTTNLNLGIEAATAPSSTVRGEPGSVVYAPLSNFTADNMAATPLGVATQIQSVLNTSIPTTRKISTISPLTGGGDLSTDRTLQINSAGTASVSADGSAGSVIYAKDTDITSRNKAATPAGVQAQIASSSHTGVPNTRSITTVAPLYGGGTLSADLTLSVSRAVNDGLPGTVVYATSDDRTSSDKAVTPSSAQRKIFNSGDMITVNSSNVLNLNATSSVGDRTTYKLNNGSVGYVTGLPEVLNTAIANASLGTVNFIGVIVENIFSRDINISGKQVLTVIGPNNKGLDGVLGQLSGITFERTKYGTGAGSTYTEWTQTARKATTDQALVGTDDLSFMTPAKVRAAYLAGQTATGITGSIDFNTYVTPGVYWWSSNTTMSSNHANYPPALLVGGTSLWGGILEVISDSASQSVSQRVIQKITVWQTGHRTHGLEYTRGGTAISAQWSEWQHNGWQPDYSRFVVIPVPINAYTMPYNGLVAVDFSSAGVLAIDGITWIHNGSNVDQTITLPVRKNSKLTTPGNGIAAVYIIPCIGE